MDLAVFAVSLYAVVSLVGGAIGYLKAKSVASLAAGAAAGVALGICAVGMAQEQPAAEAGALVVSALLALRFFGTWRARRRVMPDLLMWGLGAAAIVSVSLRRLLGTG